MIEAVNLQETSEYTKVSLLIDSGVKRTLVSEKDWKTMKTMENHEPTENLSHKILSIRN